MGVGSGLGLALGPRPECVSEHYGQSMFWLYRDYGQNFKNSLIFESLPTIR